MPTNRLLLLLSAVELLFASGTPTIRAASPAQQSSFVMVMNVNQINSQIETLMPPAFPAPLALTQPPLPGATQLGTSISAVSDNLSDTSPDVEGMTARVALSAEEKVMNWVNFLKTIVIGGIAVTVASCIGIVAFFARRTVGSVVDEKIKAELSKLEIARQDAISTTATTKAQLADINRTTDTLRITEAKLEVDLGRIELDRQRLQAELRDARNGLNEEILDRSDQLLPTIQVINMVLKGINSFPNAREAVLSNLKGQLLSSYSSDDDRSVAASYIQELRDYEPALKVLVEALKAPELENSLDTLLTAIGNTVKDAKVPVIQNFRETALSALPVFEAILKEPNHPNIGAAIGTVGDYSTIVEDPQAVVMWLLALTVNMPPLSREISLQEAANPEFAVVYKAVPLAFAAYSAYSESAVPWLIQMLDVQVPEIRRNAAIALGAIGPKAISAIAALGKLSRDSQELSDVRAICREAATQLTRSEL